MSIVKTLYFDCFSGISGDMTIGALIDLGVDFDDLRTELAKLPLPDFTAATDLALTRVDRSGISASKFDVLVGDDGHDPPAHPVGAGHEHATGHDEPRHSHGHHAIHTHHDHSHGGERHAHRKASEIIAMISRSPLDAPVRARAVAIFEKLAISEGMVHDLPPGEVTFHEVGAIDSIVDVVGTAIGIETLGIERFACSPINVGGGFIHCQHGVYPVPAPATANLLTAATVYSKHVEKELVTPTGAAILAATVDTFERFGGGVGMRIDRVGYGAGTMNFPGFPNCLRLVLGESPDEKLSGVDHAGVAEILMVEANIDDMTAEQLAYAAERLMASGALDVTLVPAVMKKGRPGHVLQVMAAPSDEARLSRVIFAETTTIGVRSAVVSRRVLDRESVAVTTSGGPVRVKVSRLGNDPVNVSPEYDDCARIASSTGRPLREIQEEALAAYRNQKSQERS